MAGAVKMMKVVVMVMRMVMMVELVEGWSDGEEMKAEMMVMRIVIVVMLVGLVIITVPATERSYPRPKLSQVFLMNYLVNFYNKFERLIL